jgi:ATP-binding cassette subfamily C protein CydD
LAARQQSAEQRILRYSRSARALLYLAVAAGFLAAAFGVILGYLLSVVVDDVFLGHQTLPAVTPLMGALVGLALARAAAIFCSDTLAQRSASILKGSLRQQLARHIFDLGPAYTRGQSSGELVHATVDGLEVLDEYITVYQPVRLLSRLVPVFVLLVILALDPPTTLILLFTGPLLLILLALIGGRTQDITERRFRELSWMSAFFLDMLQGIATLKLFGRSREQIANIREISRHYGNTTMEVLQTAFQSALVLEFGGTVATALVAVEVSLRLMGGVLPFQRALAVLVITPEFFLPLRQFAVRYHAGAAGKAAAERIFAILDTPLAASRRPGSAATLLPACFDIRFEDVHVAYEGGARPALRGFSLSIPQGQTVALVGATGAGKTTAANLLLRFVDADAGTITVGGVALNEIDLSRWRSCLGWVPQLPHLFHGTVADNIGLARPDASMADIIAAAEAAHAHEFIQTLPQGYETPLGEEGARLSGGQQQRLAIARAFLKDAPVLILDEATSHLDAQSEAAIQDALAHLMHGRTVLIIAHRLKMVYAADQVALMEQGRVIETGDHQSLLAHPGLYRNLVASYEGDVR